MASSLTLSRERSRLFYGWWMVPVAVMASLGTLPGQSVGVAAFNESLQRDLSLSPSQLSGLYAIGTIIAACVLPATGMIMDRIGIRWTMLSVVVALAATCGLMSRVEGPWLLLVSFFLLRFLGQGSLSLLANNTLAMWFHRRLGTVAGCSSLMVTIGMGLAPLGLKSAIETWGWRATYQALGGILLCALVPPLLTWYRNRPEEIGLRPDGETHPLEPSDTAPGATPGVPHLEGMTLFEALKTRAYWILVLMSTSWALIGTGLIFNVQPLAAEKLNGDWTPELAVTCFFLAVAGCQLLGGVAADRLALHRLLLLATGFMVVSLLALYLGRGWSFFLTYALYGSAQGIILAVSSTVWVRYFGRRQLGTIKSVGMMAMVAGSSVGPLIMGLCKDTGYSYNASLLLFLALALLNVATISVLRPPQKPVPVPVV